MTKKLDLSKPPFQTDENPPRPARLICDDACLVDECLQLWLVKSRNGLETILARNPNEKKASSPAIVNAPCRIPFWVRQHATGYVEVTKNKHRPTKEWRGPFYMDGDGNPVSGEDE